MRVGYSDDWKKWLVFNPDKKLYKIPKYNSENATYVVFEPDTENFMYVPAGVYKHNKPSKKGK